MNATILSAGNRLSPRRSSREDDGDSPGNMRLRDICLGRQFGGIVCRARHLSGPPGLDRYLQDRSTPGSPGTAKYNGLITVRNRVSTWWAAAAYSAVLRNRRNRLAWPSRCSPISKRGMHFEGEQLWPT
jgi:hypothetical protein